MVSGGHILGMRIAQTFYTDDEVVSDTANTNYETRRSYSDIAASIDMAVEKFSVSSAVQYNPDQSKIVKKTNTISYMPSSKKFISLIISTKLEIFPVLRLSTTVTLCLFLTRKSHKFEPIKPDPPVTKTFI